MSLPNQLTPRPTQDSITVERNAVATVTPVRTDKAYLAPVPGSVVQFDPQGKVVSDCNVPIILRVKDVPVLTAGAPADIATITVPAGITRYCISAKGPSGETLGFIVAETAVGSLNGASFIIYTAPDAGGDVLCDETFAPLLVGTKAFLIGGEIEQFFNSPTLVVRQTGASTNAGTVSFYITIFPLP